MPKPLTPQQKSTATLMLTAKMPQKQIAQAAQCSVSQIKRMAKNMRRWGNPTAPKIKPQGRPRALDAAVVEGLTEYFMQHPFAHLGDLVTFINQNYHITTTKSTVSRVLKRAKLDRMELQSVAKDQDENVPGPVTFDSGGSAPLTVVVMNGD